MKTNVEKQDLIRHGPFTWVRRDQGQDETWELKFHEDAKLAYWCVKNYGGTPEEGNAFSGWRLVSGGPFTDAGGWTNRREAIEGVTPYLREKLLKRIQEELDRMEARESILLEVCRSIGKG